MVGSLNTTLKRGENTQRELEHGEQSEESEDVVKPKPFLRAVLSHSPSIQADIYSQVWPRLFYSLCMPACCSLTQGCLYTLQVQLSEMLRSDLNAQSTTLGTDWSSYEALFAYIERNSRRAVTRLLSIVQVCAYETILGYYMYVYATYVSVLCINSFLSRSSSL